MKSFCTCAVEYGEEYFLLFYLHILTSVPCPPPSSVASFERQAYALLQLQKTNNTSIN